MRANVGDGWRYKVYLNGEDVSNVVTEAVSILGIGYVWRIRERDGFIVYDTNGIILDVVWGFVHIVRIGRTA